MRDERTLHRAVKVRFDLASVDTRHSVEVFYFIHLCAFVAIVFSLLIVDYDGVARDRSECSAKQKRTGI